MTICARIIDGFVTWNTFSFWQADMVLFSSLIPPQRNQVPWEATWRRSAVTLLGPESNINLESKQKPKCWVCSAKHGKFSQFTSVEHLSTGSHNKGNKISQMWTLLESRHMRISRPGQAICFAGLWYPKTDTNNNASFIHHRHKSSQQRDTQCLCTQESLWKDPSNYLSPVSLVFFWFSFFVWKASHNGTEKLDTMTNRAPEISM